MCAAAIKLLHTSNTNPQLIIVGLHLMWNNMILVPIFYLNVFDGFD